MGASKIGRSSKRGASRTWGKHGDAKEILALHSRDVIEIMLGTVASKMYLNGI